MAKWVLFICGLLLLVSGVSVWYWLSLRPDSAEAEFALTPLVQIPVAEIARQGNLELDNIHGKTPSRIKRSWGQGDYVLAALSMSRHLQYCFDSLQVKVLYGPKLEDLGLSNPVCGYGSAYEPSCHSTGRKFRLADGEESYLQIAGGIDGLPSDAEIVLVRSWTYTKDKLVSIDIDRYIRKIANWLVNVGIVTSLLSGFLFAWSRCRSRAPVHVAP
jgi:hypothetical protein